MDFISNLFGLKDGNKKVEFSKEQRLVNYILKTKQEYDEASDMLKAIDKTISIANEIILSRKDGAYNDVLSTEVYLLKREWEELINCTRRCVGNLPAIHDQLDKKYHYEALQSPKATADVARIRAKGVAEHLEACTKMLMEFEEYKPTGEIIKKEVLPWLHRYYKRQIN